MSTWHLSERSRRICGLLAVLVAAFASIATSSGQLSTNEVELPQQPIQLAPDAPSAATRFRIESTYDEVVIVASAKLDSPVAPELVLSALDSGSGSVDSIDQRSSVKQPDHASLSVLSKLTCESAKKPCTFDFQLACNSGNAEDLPASGTLAVTVRMAGSSPGENDYLGVEPIE